MSTPHLHAFTATVTLKDGGEPREIPYDAMCGMNGGFYFQALGAPSKWLPADRIAEIEMTDNPHHVATGEVAQ
jgi:hypothetical protein